MPNSVVLEAQQRYNLALINDASSEQRERSTNLNSLNAHVVQLDNLQLQIDQAQLNLETITTALEQAQFQIDIEEEISNQKRQQFKSFKQLEQSSNAIAISREYQQQSQALTNCSKELNIQAQEANSIVNFRNSEYP